MENEAPIPSAEQAPRRPSPYYDDDYGRRRPLYSAFPPLLLLVLAAIAWGAFQCSQLVVDKEALANVRTNQTKSFDDAAKLRGQLEAVARDTMLLAEQGHPGAKAIVDELARRGVRIDPNATPSTPPGSGK